MMSLEQAMKRYRAGTIDVDGLLRAWILAPVIYMAASERDYRLEPRSYVVPGGWRYDYYTREELCPEPRLVLAPAHALRMPLIRFVEVTLDRGTDREVRLPGELGGVLTQWGRVGSFEQWCVTGEAPYNPSGPLRGYRTFYVLLDDRSDPVRLEDAVLLFTARNALDAWRQSHPDGTPETVRGRDLMGVLDRDTRVLVNPAGPVGPLSLPADFHDHLDRV